MHIADESRCTNFIFTNYIAETVFHDTQNSDNEGIFPMNECPISFCLTLLILKGESEYQSLPKTNQLWGSQGQFGDLEHLDGKVSISSICDLYM